MLAEKRLLTGDLKTSQDLAEQALHDGHEDAGRALFILAQIATAKRDMAGATGYFEQALKVAQEPKVIAWSHIYLGRIFDLQERRENALDEYHAALTAGATLPEVKAAAEKGLKQPYEPPAQQSAAGQEISTSILPCESRHPRREHEASSDDRRCASGCGVQLRAVQ